MAKSVHEQLAAARARMPQWKENKTAFAKELGYAHGGAVSDIESGGNANLKYILKWAELCDCEILVVPKGSKESVLARMDEADQRELRLTAGFLDLLLELRAAGQDHVVDFLERELGRWREWLPEKRDALDRTAG